MPATPRPTDGLDGDRAIRIFGRDVLVRAGPTRAGTILLDELRAYPDAAGPADLAVVLGAAARGGLVNPSTHEETAVGFRAEFPGITVGVRFVNGTVSQLDLAVPARTTVRRYLARWRSNQFTDPAGLIGQKFHEIGMVLALMADPGARLLHATAVAIDGVATAVGGTGGVGKTTLGIQLCLRHGAGFLADDLTMIDDQGLVHPNLAYPKIYAYNLAGDAELRDRVLATRPLDDRVQWFAKRTRRQGGARRRIAPTELYGPIPDPTPLGRYLIVVRERRADVLVRPIDPLTAAELSVDVLRAELDGVTRHLWWHRYNRRILGADPLLDPVAVFERWRSTLAKTLATVDCRVVRVPIGMPIDDYREQLVRLVLG